jgi:hypothetical protein
LALKERQNSVNFQKAVKFVPYLSDDTKTTVDVLKWAYNVVATRSVPSVDGSDLYIAPMADMFNHGTFPEVEVTLDEQGNCMAYTTRDVPAGSALHTSYGDPTNPTPLFARYGFLDESSPATFCKLLHMEREMRALGYDFSNLLFYKDTGDISPEVYDVVLYSILKSDPINQEGFYEACMRGDVGTKNQYHEQYLPYTLQELRRHVDDTLRDLDRLSTLAASKDPRTHPRAPVILKHNQFVRETFSRVKANLDRMG